MASKKIERKSMSKVVCRQYGKTLIDPKCFQLDEVMEKAGVPGRSLIVEIKDIRNQFANHTISCCNKKEIIECDSI